ncbi:MAG: pentapeptide repeat-containing protein [Gammaproteobacteria bacterium]|jgi:hypothetical protein
MNGESVEKALWYARRDGDVRGPYPAGQIGRYILLGRIRETDEVSQDAVQWAPVSAHPELLPPEMLDADSEQGRQRLLLARLREDERSGLDRREGPAAGERRERRRLDRRAPEADTLVRRRRARARLGQGRAEDSPTDFRVVAVLAVLVLALTIVFVRYTPPVHRDDVQCSAAPGPGVDWNNCHRPGLHAPGADLLAAHMYSMDLTGSDLRGAHLHGADLAYATLSIADLQDADLSDARLTGAGLRNADLRSARLTDADLSYAVLRGARLAGAQLRGARLDHAIWVDGTICAQGSVGYCRSSGTRAAVPGSPGER